jgi:hypothetical protein
VSERYPEHILLDSQWDAAYDVIKALGFNPSDFARATTFGRNYNGMVPNLIHVPSGSEFVFDFDPQQEKHAAEWSPGEEQPRDKTTMMDWQLVLGVLTIWLQNVKREQTTPNFWERIGQERDLLAATGPTGDTDNSPFSLDEQGEVAKQLNEVKELLARTYQLDGEQLNGIQAGLDDLRESSQRMGRREWLMMFVGTVTTWVLTGLIPPEGAPKVLNLALRGLGHLFGGGMPELPV